MDIVYDIETFPNVFTLAAECADAPFTWEFEISPWVNDSHRLIQWLYWMRERGYRMAGFNNLGFDYPIIHMIAKMGNANAEVIWQKAQAIIHSQNEDEGNNRWTHQVYPGDRIVTQLDLYRIHHFDNRARMTSLKSLQFNMGSESVEDLPYPVGTVLTQDQVPVLKRYGRHDVSETKKFYHLSRDMIRFREELTAKYSRDFLNHNDTKIGKDYFIMRLEEAGVSCYDYTPDKGRSPRQTKRPIIALGDAILPWIKFENPEFQRVLDWLRTQKIAETKGVFKDLTAKVGGLDFIFGTGGIHASVENEMVESDEEYQIVDLDVSSYYPNLAIVNQFAPAHFDRPTFAGIYQQLYEQRKSYKKGTAENAMLKLALNGCYGDSNNPFSVFYDPLFTMSTTLNGQLLLCLLAQELLAVPGLRLLQTNTDGITVRLPHAERPHLDLICQWWQELTKLTLESVNYRMMAIRDCNSYIAMKSDGSANKRKGAYAHQFNPGVELDWHKDWSALVVPKVAEKVLTEGAPIRETIAAWPNLMDFMQRIRVNRGSYLSWTTDAWGDTQFSLPNTVRYYVAKGGVQLWKWMPPLKKKPTEWRQQAVESGYTVQIANNLKDGFDAPPDPDYYTREVEKLVMRIK